MPELNPNQKPKYFWQGVLILLPVAVLAVVSLISLRQEERGAEEDARKRAAENAQSLARAVRSSVNEELHRFISLQIDWLTFIGNQRGAGLASLDAKLKADMEKWKQDYPTLRAAEWPLSEGEILTDGRQVFPPERPVVPTPPNWFLELSAQQRDLWRNLRSATSLADIKTSEEAFLDSNPSKMAQFAALELTNPPEQFAKSQGLFLTQHSPYFKGVSFPTESGISFEDIACFRVLSATNAQFSEPLLRLLWYLVIENPSFVAPKLLGLAEGLTNNAVGAICQRVSWMQFVWDEQSRTARWLEPIRRLPELQPLRSESWSHWTDNGEALAIIAPGGKGYIVSFIPDAVVEAIFTKALAENRFFIPDYAVAAVTVEGRPLHPRDKIAGGDGNDLLGRAEQRAGNDPLTRDAVRFDLKFVLASREQMLSTGRRRARLFAGLILGTVFAAVAGLVSARRAFYRQLQLNEMKSNFVSSVSHELRAPIASVRLMAENLERGKIPDAPRQREYFRFIVQECRRLSSLIENVLDFSRIEQGRKQYEFEPTDVLALARTTVKLMEPCATEKEVSLDASNIPLPAPEQGEGGAIELNVDGRAIQQALVNLIDNAIKHSPKGETVAVGVEIRDGPAAPLFCLSVSDHGPGIPAAEHEKIFERFYRRGSELRRETQGVGIGLSVVQHIVAAHGGRIVVQSEPGKGSKFTIELPMRNQNE
jgi:signal transduction histidine kinase